jgi:hypothetical protein
MSYSQQMFQQFGNHDLEKYAFLGAPAEWTEDVVDQLTSKVRESMEQRIRDMPPEFLSHSNGSYLLMRATFQFAEAAIWQHAFSEMGSEAPNRGDVTRSLAQWFDNYSGVEDSIVHEFTCDSLDRYRSHGEHHPPTTARIAKILAAIRNNLAAHFMKDDLPDGPVLFTALRELTQ